MSIAGYQEALHLHRFLRNVLPCPILIIRMLSEKLISYTFWLKTNPEPSLSSYKHVDSPEEKKNRSILSNRQLGDSSDSEEGERAGERNPSVWQISQWGWRFGWNGERLWLTVDAGAYRMTSSRQPEELLCSKSPLLTRKGSPRSERHSSHIMHSPWVKNRAEDVNV